jgi:hypothetical protein
MTQRDLIAVDPPFLHICFVNCKASFCPQPTDHICFAFGRLLPQATLFSARSIVAVAGRFVVVLDVSRLFCPLLCLHRNCSKILLLAPPWKG